MDPKRYLKKVRELREKIQEGEHFFLGEIVNFLPERCDSNGKPVRVKPSSEYSYVEIADIGYGDFYGNKILGWQMPSRAKHFTEENDIYFGSIWGSVSKWCYIGSGYENFVVTNGCHRCRIKSGKEGFLVDLIAYMNTEGWSVQMRSLARGSDGLAEIAEDDAKSIVIPRIKEEAVREEIHEFVENLKQGRVTIKSVISELISNRKWDIEDPKKRSSHIVLV